jgi:hypothetical protein
MDGHELTDRNQNGKNILCDIFKFRWIVNAVKTKKLDFVAAMSCNSLRRLGRPLYFETFAKRPLLSNTGVPAERDLSTGSNFNPRNTQCMSVVKIFAFLGLERNWAFFKGLILCLLSKG